MKHHDTKHFARRGTLAALTLSTLLLAACTTTGAPTPADTASFRMERFDEMQRLNSFNQCADDGMTLDTEARSRASTAAFLRSAQLLEGCLTDLGPSEQAVPEPRRMRLHALATVNFLKGGDIAAARNSLESFKARFPNRDLYFGNSTSFVETTEVLLGSPGEFRLGQFAALNVDTKVKREVRRVNYWKNR